MIDFNPESLRELSERGVAGTFGDLGSLDSLEHAHLHDCKLIVSTIPDMLLKGTDNATLVKTLRAVAPHASVVAVADDARHEQLLRPEGAEHLINPHTLAAESIAGLIKDALRPRESTPPLPLQPLPTHNAA